MSANTNNASRINNAGDEFVPDDSFTQDIPQGSDTYDPHYVSYSGPLPVVADETTVEQPNDEREPDSNAALQEDESEAINEQNILGGDRLRHAKPHGPYTEPGDEEELPDDTGRSSTAKLADRL